MVVLILQADLVVQDLEVHLEGNYLPINYPNSVEL